MKKLSAFALLSLLVPAVIVSAVEYIESPSFH